MKKRNPFIQNAKKLKTAAFLFALVLAASVPSVQSYARPRHSPRQNTEARRTSRSRRTTSSQAAEDLMRDTAVQVQKAFDEQDLNSLSSLCNYPLTFIDRSGNSSQIKSRSAFRALDKKEIFTKEMQELVGSVNAAKVKAENSKTLKLGEEDGITLEKKNKNWKVTRIQMKGSQEKAGSDLVQTAEQFQRTFYYRDLETLAKQCTYPLKIYPGDGTILDISSPEKLMALGESKVFTDELLKQVDQTDASQLTEIDHKVQVGETRGFWMVLKDGQWKIDMIY